MPQRRSGREERENRCTVVRVYINEASWIKNLSGHDRDNSNPDECLGGTNLVRTSFSGTGERIKETRERIPKLKLGATTLVRPALLYM